MNQEVKKVVDVLPVIRQILDDISYTTVMDSDGIVQGYAIPDGEKPMMEIGTKFQDPSGAFDEVLRTGKRKFNYLPKEVMGTAFEGVLVPIKDQGNVVGVLIYTHSADDKEQAHDITMEFKQSISEINTAIATVADSFTEMFEMLKGMNDRTTEVEGDVAKATEVVGRVRKNASRSNILALNASIEAARSGEAGRGFAVVATEMGKLSNDSGSSAKEIDEALSIVSEHLEAIVSSIQNTNVVAEGYLNSINDMKSKLEHTEVLASKLQKLIGKIPESNS